jgi:hypothetical protein
MRLSATLVFDYPTPELLADHLLERLSQRTQASGADGEEQAIRQAIASIPLGRLREAGLMESLLKLAGLQAKLQSDSLQDDGELDSIEAMDVEELVQRALRGAEGTEDAEGADGAKGAEGTEDAEGADGAKGAEGER